MDFDLTEEQTLLRDVTREVFSRSYDIATPQQGGRQRARVEPGGLGPAGRGRHPGTGLRCRARRASSS